MELSEQGLGDAPWLSNQEPPSNLGAETALLGAILANNRAYNQVAPFLRSEMFQYEPNPRVYQAISHRIEEGRLVDAVTLKGEFSQEYLASLLGAMVGIMNAGEYGRAIHDSWLRRQLIEISKDIAYQAYGGTVELDGAKQIDRAIEEIVALRESASVLPGEHLRGPRTYHEAVQAQIDRSDAMYAGRIPKPRSTGIAAVDRMIGGGLLPDTLVYMLGIGEAGKTELALQIAENVARRTMAEWQAKLAAHNVAVAAGEPSDPPGPCPGVLFFSFDMTAEQLGARAIARLGSVPLWRIRRGDLNDEAAAGMLRAADLSAAIPIELDEGTPTLAHVQGEARRFCKRRPCSLMVIDNASNIASEGDTSKLYGKFLNLTATLRRLAKLLHVPILLLMHVNQEVGRRIDPRPRFGDIPWGTQKDANFAFGVWRPVLALGMEPPKPPIKATAKSEEAHAKAVNDWHSDRERLKNVTELVPLKVGEDDGIASRDVARLTFDPTLRQFHEEPRHV